MQIHNKPYNNKLCSQLTPIPLPLSKGQLLSLASQLDQIKQTTNAIKLRIKFGPAHRRALIARANFLPPLSSLNYGGEYISTKTSYPAMRHHITQCESLPPVSTPCSRFSVSRTKADFFQGRDVALNFGTRLRPCQGNRYGL